VKHAEISWLVPIFHSFHIYELRDVKRTSAENNLSLTGETHGFPPRFSPTNPAPTPCSGLDAAPMHDPMASRMGNGDLPALGFAMELASERGKNPNSSGLTGFTSSALLNPWHVWYFGWRPTFFRQNMF